MKDVKGVIFDWGRTLFDSEIKKEFLESEEVLKYLKSKGYRLALVSLVTYHANATLEERNQQIAASPLKKYFESVITTDTDKDKALGQTVSKLGYAAENIAIVDDRTIRGIQWGNKKGCTTIWLQKGKFANELPNAETGQPAYTIRELGELKSML